MRYVLKNSDLQGYARATAMPDKGGSERELFLEELREGLRQAAIDVYG